MVKWPNLKAGSSRFREMGGVRIVGFEASRVRFERTTCRLEGGCSIQLSYRDGCWMCTRRGASRGEDGIQGLAGVLVNGGVGERTGEWVRDWSGRGRGGSERWVTVGRWVRIEPERTEYGLATELDG